MMLRVLTALCALGSFAFAQSVPSFNWTKEVGPSGAESIAGVGTDAAGNVYVAGSTSSPQFPVKAAVQGQMASSGLFRISGTGYTGLGLSSVAAIAVDPQNPATIFASSNGRLMKSTDSGATFSATNLSSTQVVALAFQPGNDGVVFAGTLDQGLLKSSDSGVTWTALIARPVEGFAIDPIDPDIILANAPGPMRTIDGGTNWQPVAIMGTFTSITFDPFHSGVVYAAATPNLNPLQSTDSGATFSAFNVPHGVEEVFPDPMQAGRLIGGGNAGLFQSTDGGTTWTQTSTTGLQSDIVADTVNGFYYAAEWGNFEVVRISSDLQTVTPLGPPANTGLAVSNGVVYAGNNSSSDVFVMKLDPSGNVLFSTFFGGTGNDYASAMTVDAAGNVFVAGTTNSHDFPVSKGAYASTGTMFVFRLNTDGSIGYSTYFSGTSPTAIATDGSGSAWVAGETELGNLPTTPMALATTFCCTQPGTGIGPSINTEEATLTRFDAAGSSLVFSTYVPGSQVTSVFGLASPAIALAVAPDDSAYVAGTAAILRVDAAGDSLIASTSTFSTNAPTAEVTRPTAMALGPDGSVYIAGTPASNFQPTAGAFQTTTIASQSQGIVRMDAKLSGVLDATYFNGSVDNIQVKTMATDAAGNLYFGGSTPGEWLPTRTPFAGGFAATTGFLAKFSGDLSSLLFSSYFGDATSFAVSGVSVAPSGAVLIGGVTGAGISGLPVNLWLNSLTLTPPPALRIDTVANAASILAAPLAAGETIEVKGAGFDASASLTIGGETVPVFSVSATQLFATVPADLPSTPVFVQVQRGGILSNPVIMPTGITSPGVFTQDGSGAGLAYILNADGSLNTPSNAARQGDRITVYATGVGPISFTNGYAVTEFPANVYIKGVFCAGVAALMGPVNGFPGNVYRITVYVPQFPILYPLSDVVIKVDGVSSEPNVYLSLTQ